MDSRVDFGKMEFGCKHYRRRCKVRAPCCNVIFGCHRCHNESTPEHHEAYSPKDVKKVICSICDIEQLIAQICMNCGVKMGEYFCEICKIYEDDMELGPFHCIDCGLCRRGGNRKFVHCNKCGDCCPVNHKCRENLSRLPCPICYESAFDTYEKRMNMKCGHYIHVKCFDKMVKNGRYSCPLCSKTVSIRTAFYHWILVEDMIHHYSPLPDPRKVWILCNDCSVTSEVIYHFAGHKCVKCLSYNTRQIPPPPVLPQ